MKTTRSTTVNINPKSTTVLTGPAPPPPAVLAGGGERPPDGTKPLPIRVNVRIRPASIEGRVLIKTGSAGVGSREIIVEGSRFEVDNVMDSENLSSSGAGAESVYMRSTGLSTGGQKNYEKAQNAMWEEMGQKVEPFK